MPHTLGRLRNLLSLLLLILSLPLNLEAQSMASLYSKQGVVEVQSAAQDKWLAVDQGHSFSSGDTIRTAASSRAALLFADGVMVRLNERSLFQVKSESGGEPETLNVAQGIAHFFSRKPQKFPKITTPLVTASIRGTEFIVNAAAAGSLISVLNGAIDCKNKHGEMRVGKGEEALVEPGKAPQKRLLINPTDAVQWALYYPAVIGREDLSDAGSTLTTPYARAVSHLERGEADQALSLLQSIKEPRPAGAMLLLASIYLSRGQVEQAGAIHASLEPRLKSLSPAASGSLMPALYAQQAIIALAKNNRDEARSKAELAYKQNQNSAAAALALSYVEQAAFDLERARDVVADALKVNSDNAILRTRYAELLLSFGDAEGALAEASKALLVSPFNDYTYTVKGFAELSRQNTKSAAEAFSKALSLPGSSGLPHLGLGLTQIREGKLSEGRVSIQQAAHLEPNVSLYRSYLGKAFFEEEDENLAAEEYSRAIELDAKDPTPHLYRAFHKLSAHDPVAALVDAENSITLNDNRAVYRSRLLLDQDSSIRSTSLAQVFNILGFSEVSRIEAIKSLSKDYTNYSAHLLLSGSYDDSSDLLQASISEFLIARLLSPVNFNLVRPSSSGTISNNEYSAAFDRNVQRTAWGLDANSKDQSVAPSVITSGTSGPWGYVLSYDGAFGEGFRDNDRTKSHSFYGSLQHQLSPNDTLLFDINVEAFDDGDTELGFEPNTNDPDLEQELKDLFVRAGFSHNFSPASRLIGQVLYNDSDFDYRDDTFDRFFFLYSVLEGEVVESADLFGTTDQDISFESKGKRADLQFLYDGDLVSLVTGAGVLDSDQEQSDEGFLVEPEELAGLSLNSFADNTESSRRVFQYATFHLAPWLDLEGGVSYNHLHLSGAPLSVPFSDGSESLTEWDPKAGLIITAQENTTVRAAYFESIGSAGIREFELIEPTLVGGFNQTFFDVFPGTRSRNYALGFDHKVPGEAYFGVEGFHRDVIRNNPISVSQVFLDFDTGETLEQSVFLEDHDAHLDEEALKAYVYYVLGQRVTGTVDYLWALDEDNFFETEAETHRGKLGVNYFDPSGFYGFVNGTWREQTLTGYEETGEALDGTRDFWIVDLGVGYRFAKRHGQVTVAVNNVLDQEFKYLATGFDTTFFPGIGASVLFSYNY